MRTAARSPRFQRRAASAALLLGVVLAAAAVIGGRPPAADLPIERYRPADDVPRLEGSSIEAAGVGRVGGFDMAGDVMYLLDPFNHTVHMLEQGPAGWAVSGRFGGHGDGPGELREPWSVAVTEDGSTVAITDGAQVHFFDGAGGYLRSARLGASCSLLRPEIAAGRSGFFVTGSCARGLTGDTLMAELYYTATGEQYSRIADDVRVTRDGRIGSFLNTATFAPGPGRHIFGAGSSPCSYLVSESVDPDAAPRVTRRCGVVATLYEADASAELLSRLKEMRARRPGSDGMLSWPRHMPTYVAHLLTPAGDVLLRSFDSDSLVMRLVGSETDLLVTPGRGFIGCRRAGCLWATESPGGTDLIFLDAAAVAQLIADRESQQ
jgi:hypothetical protein